MKREAIRKAVAEAMANKGYRRGWHGWAGCELMCWTESGKGSSLGRFPSGTSRKRLNAALSAISPIGRALPLPQFERVDTYRQTDIGEFTGDGRR